MHKSGKETDVVRVVLTSFALLYLGIMVGIPLVNLFVQGFSRGWREYGNALLTPDTIAAAKLSLVVVLWVVSLNLIFGFFASWVLVRYRFWGHSFLLAMMDLPLAVSPVVAGLMYVLVFGREGFLGPFFAQQGFPILFALPGIVLATLFVTFPIVTRELMPILEASSEDQEEAARTLGASRWQTFLWVTLPNIRWGVFYGVILLAARALGEFGAVSIVSGKITGETDTLPLRVEKLYNEFHNSGAFAVSSALACMTFLTIALKRIMEARMRPDPALRRKRP